MDKTSKKKCKSPLRKMADGGLFDNSPPFFSMNGLRSMFSGGSQPTRMATRTIGVRG